MSVINGLCGTSGSADASNISYDNANSGLESAVIQDAIDEIATLNRSIMHELVLLANNWSGIKAPFKYRLMVNGITEESTVYVSLPNDASSEQIDLVSDALLDVSGIGSGYVDIISRGNKLLVDIPVIVHVCNTIAVPHGRDAYYIKYVPPKNSPLTATTAGDAIDQLCQLVLNSRSSTAANITVDAESLKIDVHNVQEALEYFVTNGVASGRKHVPTVISVENWEGDLAPYTTSVSIEGVTDTTEASVIAPFDITVDEHQALSHAEIVTGCTSNGKVVLKAFGEKPKIDIPVDILVYL